MRLIDADVFIAYLNQVAKDYDSFYVQIMEKFINMVEIMADNEPINQWIPVSERLPSDHERYLLTEEVHYTTGRIIRRVLIAFYDDENDEWYEEMGEDVEVVSYPLAWKPLPEPYKGEEE